MASSTFSPRTGSFGAHPTAEPEERKTPSAALVASDYFKRQLTYHDVPEASDTDTVVIVNDSCYGHRYARPKTSKSALGLIVERPERLQATVLGIASAYVRLGENHSGGKNAPTPTRPPSTAIPFRIKKTTSSVPLTSPAVAAVHGSKWMQELSTMCEMADSKLASGYKELSRPDTPTNTSNTAKPKLHEGDLYLCGESLSALNSAAGGVCEAVDAVFGGTGQAKAPRKAFVGIRPPGHHCSAEHPSGFCWINNVHVGIEHAAQRYGLTHAAIIDFDLHHGDGSQAITWERNIRATKAQRTAPKNTASPKKTSIGYFSLHDVNSYPCEDGDPEKVRAASICIESAHSQTIWNVHLQPWTSQAEFWKLYEDQYLVLLTKARAFLRSQSQRVKSSNSHNQPKAAIFISAGFDASEWEMETMQRHKVNVPTDFYARFTADIAKLAEEDGTGADGRVISILEGGYSDRALMSGILSHLSGLVGGIRRPLEQTSENNGQTVQKSELAAEQIKPGAQWDNGWWSQETLVELETLVKTSASPSPPLPKKAARSTEIPTYSSPTQSYTAKVVDPSKVFRSTSGSLPVRPKSRPTTPPPPEVSWAAAAHELYKMLVPSDRQIHSHSYDELKEPRLKRDRQSSVGPQAAEISADRMQLRGRKPKWVEGAVKPLEQKSLPPRPLSKANRRRTISDLTSIAAEPSSQPATTATMPRTTDRPSTSDSGPGSPLDIQPTQASSVVASAPTSRQPSVARGPATNLTVPKTRRASGARGDLQKLSRAANEVPPVPPISSKSMQRGGGNALAKRGPKSQVTGDGQQQNSIDALSAGVKKITLKMPNQGQADGEVQHGSKPAVKTSRKGPGKSSKGIQGPLPGSDLSQVENENISSAPILTSTATELPSHVHPQQSVETGAHSLGNDRTSTDAPREHAISAPADSNADFTNGTAQAIPPAKVNGPMQSGAAGKDQDIDMELDTQAASDAMASSGDTPQARSNLQTSAQEGQTEFIPYTPPGESQHLVSHPHGHQQPLTWLPPNSDTPEQDSAKRGKENVPVFSAFGPIPFAKTRVPAQQAEGVAATPAFVQEVLPQAQQVAAEKQRENDAAVWDVPKTPQKK